MSGHSCWGCGYHLVKSGPPSPYSPEKVRGGLWSLLWGCSQGVHRGQATHRNEEGHGWGRAAAVAMEAEATQQHSRLLVGVAGSLTTQESRDKTVPRTVGNSQECPPSPEHILEKLTCCRWGMK